MRVWPRTAISYTAKVVYAVPIVIRETEFVAAAVSACRTVFVFPTLLHRLAQVRFGLNLAAP